MALSPVLKRMEASAGSEVGVLRIKLQRKQNSTLHRFSKQFLRHLDTQRADFLVEDITVIYGCHKMVRAARILTAAGPIRLLLVHNAKGQYIGTCQGKACRCN